MITIFSKCNPRTISGEVCLFSDKIKESIGDVFLKGTNKISGREFFDLMIIAMKLIDDRPSIELTDSELTVLEKLIGKIE